MSKKVVTEYKGIKYSLQPHGLKSRAMVLFFSFVLAFGGAFAVASPAQAAGTIKFVTVCGNGFAWYVNPDEWTADTKDDNQGDRRPFPTSDGLVFGPTDLIHHQTNFFIDADLDPGTFVADPAPDLPDFFSIEVWNDAAPIKYGTLRWNSSLNKWSVTTGGSTFTGTDPEALLKDHDLSTHAKSFGVGYTNSPPGTVTSLVSSINFRGIRYELNCPVPPSPSPSPVIVYSPSPSPVVMVTTTQVPMPGTTKIVTVIQKVPIIPVNSTTSSTAEELSPSSDPPQTIGPQSSGNSLSASPVVAGVEDASSGSKSLKTFGILVAGAGGLALLGLGAAGAVTAVRRRRQRQNYQGSHHVETNNTYDEHKPSDDDDYYDKLHNGETTTQFPPVRGSYPGEDDTSQIPPVS